MPSPDSQNEINDPSELSPDIQRDLGLGASPVGAPSDGSGTGLTRDLADLIAAGVVEDGPALSSAPLAVTTPNLQPRPGERPARRRAIRRAGGERYLLISLIAFAATVIVTRTYLELTGYPQIGNGTLHIAHVLWGGLILFIAALLPLTLANRWAFSLGAVLSGVGVGLFIDEVGKFITRANDYFYPPAAPIIYAFFLITVMIYLSVRRPMRGSPRADMYAALQELTEVPDGDFEPDERLIVRAQLTRAAGAADDPNTAHLAAALLSFLDRRDLDLIERSPDRLERSVARLEASARRIPRPFQRRLLGGGLLLLGGLALIQFTLLILRLASINRGVRLALQPAMLAAVGGRFTGNPYAILLRYGLTAMVGAALVAAAVLLLTGRERRGVQVGVIGLVIALTMLGLLTFYVDQFRAITTALLQFVVLLGALTYRRLYLSHEDPPVE
jgi:hypothetical protein